MLIGLILLNQGRKLKFMTLTYIRFEKKLSQNFLINNDVASNIVDLLDVNIDDYV